MSNLEYVVLVDSNDRMIGIEEKIKAHQLALLHRAFSVFIYRQQDNRLEFLLQQRHSDKYHCGGLWTNTCCSHPRVEETVVSAAQRRLKEEMSIAVPLTVIGSFEYKASFENGLTEHELDHVLIGEYDIAQPVVVNPEEVQDFSWMSATALLEDLSLHPHRYTPWLKPALNLVLETVCFNY